MKLLTAGATTSPGSPPAHAPHENPPEQVIEFALQRGQIPHRTNASATWASTPFAGARSRRLDATVAASSLLH